MIGMEVCTAKSLRSRTMFTFQTVPSLENSTSPWVGAELLVAAFSNSSLAIFEQPSKSSFPSPSISLTVKKGTPDLENYTIATYTKSKSNGTIPKVIEAFAGVNASGIPFEIGRASCRERVGQYV